MPAIALAHPSDTQTPLLAVGRTVIRGRDRLDNFFDWTEKLSRETNRPSDFEDGDGFLGKYYRGVDIATIVWACAGDDRHALETRHFLLAGYNSAAVRIMQQVRPSFPPSMDTQLGKTIAEVFPDYPDLAEFVWQCFEDKHLLRRWGTLSPNSQDAFAFVFAYVAPNAVVWHFEAVCDRRQIALELERRVRQQSAVAELGRRELEGVSLSVLLHDAVRLAADALSVPFGDLLELLPNGKAFGLRAGVGWKSGLVGYARMSAAPTYQPGYTLFHRRSAATADLRLETRFSASPLQHNHGAIASISAVVPGKPEPFGVLSIHARESRQFTPQEIHFLEAIARIIGAAVQRDRIREQLELMQRAIHASSNGIIIADAVASDTPVIYVNTSFEAMTGYSAEEILGRNCRLLQRGDRNQEALDRIRAAIDLGQDCHVVLRNYRKNGDMFWNELHIAPVFDREGHLTHFIGIQTDVTDRKRMEERLRWEATHDALTGLPNRLLLRERLEEILARCRIQKREPFALLFLDFDRFKVVNDSLGHAIGDRLLVAIAQKLLALAGQVGLVTRLGGDEFAILLNATEDSACDAAIARATAIADSIHTAFKVPFYLDSYEVHTSASIGIVAYHPDYTTAEELLRDADLAMYRAKELGRARYEVFDPAMHARTIQRLQLETDLRRAIVRREFEVYYQPIMSLKQRSPANKATYKLAGFEALLRWRHPERGWISPAEFIPIAEETGLILPIGQWVLHQACHQLQHWLTHFHLTEPLFISVNLSGKQIAQANLLEHVVRVLIDTGLEAQRLKLEITESILIENPETAIAVLGEIRDRKIQLCLDDFGTGYSSLSYLHRFPVSTLKIDRSFVSCLGKGELYANCALQERQENKPRSNPTRNNVSIVRAILAMAHSLSMNAIAEGAETLEQVEDLQALDCDAVQGYFFSKPLPAAAAEQFLCENLL